MNTEPRDVFLRECQERWFAKATTWMNDKSRTFMYIDGVPRRAGATVFMCMYFVKHCMRDGLDMCLVTFRDNVRDIIDTIILFSRCPIFSSDGTKLHDPVHPFPSRKFIADRVISMYLDQSDIPKHAFVLVDSAIFITFFRSLLLNPSDRISKLKNCRVFGISTGAPAFPEISGRGDSI